MSDEVVWITGGGSGIGLAIAKAYAARGAKVAISGRRAAKLEEGVAALAAAGGEGLAVPCDVTDEAAVQAAAAAVLERWGRLDVAVANAGFSVSGRIEKLSAEDWRRQLDVNVVGAAVTAAAAIPALRETEGRLGLVGSVSGFLIAPGFGAYQVSKFALRALSLTLSQELHGSGVSCTGIHPGFVESDIARVDNQGVYHQDRKDKRPAKLMWKADDAARVIVRALDKRKVEFVFTGHGKLGAFIGQHFPGLVHFVSTRGAGRRSAKLEG